MTEHEKMIKAALFRAQHRGSKEADLIIGGFTQRFAHCLEAEELQSLIALLSYDDPDVLYWIAVHAAAPAQFSRSLLQKMYKFSLQMLGESDTKHVV
jgi:antitoxin CptB